MALDATRSARVRCPRCSTDLTVQIEVNDGTATAYVHPADVTHPCVPPRRPVVDIFGPKGVA